LADGPFDGVDETDGDVSVRFSEVEVDCLIDVGSSPFAKSDRAGGYGNQVSDPMRSRSDLK